MVFWHVHDNIIRINYWMQPHIQQTFFSYYGRCIQCTMWHSYVCPAKKEKTKYFLRKIHNLLWINPLKAYCFIQVYCAYEMSSFFSFFCFGFLFIFLFLVCSRLNHSFCVFYISEAYMYNKYKFVAVIVYSIFCIHIS